MREPRRALSPIGIRLALATLFVAVGAIGLLATLTLVAAVGDVNTFARQQQGEAAAATTAAVADAYQSAGSWGATDLRVGAALAADSQAVLSVRDEAGRAIPVPPTPGATTPPILQGAIHSSPIIRDGQRVGTVTLHFYRSTSPSATIHLRDALVRTVVVSAGLAALLALGVAVLLSRRITRPIVTLIDTIHSAESGDRKARVGQTRAPGELAVLAAAFDRMADTIEHENDLRRAIVADVAHELRTPLAILQANLESLTDGLTVASPSILSSLHEEVLRLARTVDDLDTLAVAAAATLRLDGRPVDLSEIAARTIDAFRPSYRDKGVQLSANLSPVVALADPHRVEQILTNLLANALKFTEAGGTATVTLRADTDTATVEVADTGVGIPPDELSHVFERFWRGKQQGRLAGSGLGLAVVQTLVAAHQGAVTVTSTPAEGTRVRIDLPVPMSTSAARALNQPTAPGEQA